MVIFTINFQAKVTDLNLKLLFGSFPVSRTGDKILTHRLKIDQNALDYMAVSPDRENVSIIIKHCYFYDKFSSKRYKLKSETFYLGHCLSPERGTKF